VRFLISGASGFIGTYLTEFLRARQQHGVGCLVRHTPNGSDEFQWNPDDGTLDAAAFDGIDAVINLSGASIAGRRWTESYKRVLMDSRVKPTTLLVEAMARIGNPPRVFVSFSGAGIYGYHGMGFECDEQTPAGATFIASLAQQWEAAAQPARDAGIQVIHPRLGSVMGNGGMLKKLAPMFRFGLGARLGNGRQAFSWIALDDIGPAILHCIEHQLEGAVNFTAPQTVDNAQFTRLLAKTVHRPALISAPARLLKLMVGGLADEMLHGQRVVPQRLTDSGYQFRFPALEAAVEHYVPQVLHRG